MEITIQIDDKEQAILGFMMKDFMRSDELERLRCENEKLSATIDKVRVAMRKRGSVVAIQSVNQAIYEHDHGDDDGNNKNQ
jgi:hypothetical protein